MEKQYVTEEMHPEKEWFAEAENINMKDLPAFIEKMMHGYHHDYGTACHAVAACALAAAWATCSEEGLTGFQAGFVMWDFIRNWVFRGNECGLRLIDYDDMLYPQYADKYEKVISEATWEKIRKKAEENLAEHNDANGNVVRHWKRIASGEVPFGYKVVDLI